MTTLVYHKDVIAADSLQFVTAADVALPLRGPKVFLNKDKTIAYGVCGHYVLDSSREESEAWIEKQLLRFKKGENLEPLIKKGRGFYMTVMTTKGTYVVNHNNPNVKITEINASDYFVHGTGGDYAILVISMGGDAIEAVAEAKRRDNLSGCDTYAINRSILKPHKEI